MFGIHGDVYGWYQLPISSSGCDPDIIGPAADVAATANGVNLAQYQHVLYLFPYLNTCHWAGLADMPGSNLWINGYLETGVVAHELGHNLGAAHAGLYRCKNASNIAVAFSASCTDDEYGDELDSMGDTYVVQLPGESFAGAGRFFSSWHRAQIGELPAKDITYATTSGNYTVNNVNDMATDNTKLLMIPRRKSGQNTTSWYAVESRSPLSVFDNWASGSLLATGALIRLVPAITDRNNSHILDMGPTTATFDDAALASGASFTDSDYGITIQNTQSGLGSAQLHVQMSVVSDTSPPSTTQLQGAYDNGAQLSWSAATDDEGVDHYEIHRDNVLLGTTKVLSFTDTPPGDVSSAAYNVVAVDQAGNRSVASNTVIVAFPDTVAPTAVAQLQGVHQGKDNKLSWQAANDNRPGSVIYLVRANGIDIASTTATSYLHGKGGLAPQKYQVVAADGAGNRSPVTTIDVAAINTHNGVTLTSPKTTGTNVKVPSRRKLTFTASGAQKLRVAINNKRVASTSSSKIRVVLSKSVTKRSKTTVQVTATINKKNTVGTFVIRKGTILLG